MTEVRNLASKISLGTGSLHRPDVGWQGGIRQGSFGRPPRQNLCSATRRRDSLSAPHSGLIRPTTCSRLESAWPTSTGS